MFLGDEGDGKAACGTGRFASIPYETETLPVYEVKELSLPVYDPNRGRLHPWKLYALIHVIFSNTNMKVYLHKKNNLSIG